MASENETTEREEFDFDEFFNDFGEYLDSKPDNYSSRFQKWFRIFAHGTFTLATNGLWIVLFTVYVGWKFVRKVDLDSYKKTVVFREDLSEESEGNGLECLYCGEEFDLKRDFRNHIVKCGAE